MPPPSLHLTNAHLTRRIICRLSLPQSIRDMPSKSLRRVPSVPLPIMLAAAALYAVLPRGVSGVGTPAGEHGRCLADAVSAGDGAVVLYDVVVNLQSMRVFFVGPRKVLWIVPVTPALQARTVTFMENFGEGRDLHWLPRRHDAASTCDFSRSIGADTSEDTSSSEETNTYVTMHGDPFEHVNLASCPLPVWAASELRAGRDVSVVLALAPKALFQAIPCTESNGTNHGACEACRSLLQRQAGGVMQPDLSECQSSSQMAQRFVRLPPMQLCLPPPLPPVDLSLCCIMKNEARYLREWLEYSRLVGVSRVYLYDHNRYACQMSPVK